MRQTIHPSEIITMNATARQIVIVIANVTVNIGHVTKIPGNIPITRGAQISPIFFQT